EVCVALPGATRPEIRRAPLAAYPGDNGSWPALAAVLRDLLSGVDASGVTVALLPPLVELNRLELPPLDEADLLQLLSRNAGRYFVSARGPQTVGVIQWDAKRGATASTLASAASTRLVAAIHGAVRDAGGAIGAITPAEGAWTAAARALWPVFAR